MPPARTVIIPKQGERHVYGVPSPASIIAQNDMPIGVEGEGGQIAAFLGRSPAILVHRGRCSRS